MNENKLKNKKIIFIFLVGVSCWWILFTLNFKTQTIDYVNDTPSQILEKYNHKGLSLLKQWYPDEEDLKFSVKYLGRTFPVLNVKTLNDSIINNDSFKNKKSVVIVGASYCENCEEVSKALNGLYSDDIQSIYIYPKDNIANIEQYYKKTSIPLDKNKIVLGSQNTTMSIVKDLHIKAIPLILFVDENGKISYVHLGSATKEELNTYKERAFSNTKVYKKLKPSNLFY